MDPTSNDEAVVEAMPNVNEPMDEPKETDLKQSHCSNEGGMDYEEIATGVDLNPKLEPGEDYQHNDIKPPTEEDHKSLESNTGATDEQENESNGKLDNESSGKQDTTLKTEAQSETQLEPELPVMPPVAAVPPPVIIKPRPKKISRPIYSKLRLKAKCHLCGHYFKRSCLGRHIKYVHGEIVVQCTICKRCFNRPDSARHHVTLHHKIDTALSRDYLTDVKKRDLPEEEVPPLRRRAPGTSTSEVLRTVRIYNCFDCESSFNSISDLFKHCEVHRYDENGRKWRTLVPPKLRATRNPTKISAY